MTAATDISDDSAWRAVLARDEGQDGQFVYGVTSTGIYCRPSCPSRRPRRDRVRFFSAPEGARAEGFRPCRRCRPDADDASPVTTLAEGVRTELERRFADEPDGRVTLAELADAVGTSPFHLQRSFVRVYGVSPAGYLRRLRSDRMKQGLRQGASVSRATYDAGFASASRGYAAAERHLGMTPGEYRAGGEGTELRYTTARCGLGRVLVAASDRGVSAVLLGDDDAELERSLAAEFPRAQRRPGDAQLREWVGAVVKRIEGEPTGVPLDLRGTAFQLRVWAALQEIPSGQTRTYTEIARTIGRPSAARAVAGACAANHAAVVVPCHRVVRGDGGLGGYRWGVERKQRLLEQEGAR